LFKITADPYEEKDLADAEPEQVKALETRLAELRKDDLNKIPDDLKNQPQ
jgi:hypothetical protein